MEVAVDERARPSDASVDHRHVQGTAVGCGPVERLDIFGLA
jgi:hypothetical protein